MQGWSVVLAAVGYLLFLFVVASFGDRRRRNVGEQRSRPAIYALSLAIYCTSWTFFGSVGLAATSGLDFLAIYLGPILMITFGFPLFNHIISVAKAERITSIADFIASRYGKSTTVGALAAVIAVLGTVPYIALQLKAISTSVDTMVTRYQPGVFGGAEAPVDTSFFVSLLLALFAILFGTRHADATEHQDGLMLAVATESIVKLIAFLAVGLFVTFFLFDGVGDIIAQASDSAFVTNTFFGGIYPVTFAVFTLLSFCAFVLLPRQFHVGVVENHSEAEARAARWMFPFYLVLINLFVIPVAVAGMLTFGTSVDADSYVLALPLDADSSIISLTVFIGGLSAATAMVIVACVALAIMISNNLVLPLILGSERFARMPRPQDLGRDMAPFLLKVRRTAIFGILTLAYAYFQVAGDSAALASIGLLSFAAVAQFAPAFFGGMVWRRATARGAIWGMIAGFAMWFYTLFLPTVLDSSASLLLDGPFGISWFRPQGLFGIDATAINHGVFVSLATNALIYVGISLSRLPKPIERMQAHAFSLLDRRSQRVPLFEGRSITVAELKATTANYLGRERCERAFDLHFRQGNDTPETRQIADDNTIVFAENLLASAIGAASSRLVMSLLLQKHDPTDETTIQLLGDASEALQYNRDLLQTALDQVEQGISVFDREFRLSSWNRQFRTLLDLPQELGNAGTPLATIASSIGNRTTPSSDAVDDFTKRLLEVDQPLQITMAESGRIIEILTKTVPDGGLVISWNDMTEKVTAARDLQTANETLERRVHERTQELTRLNADLASARESAEAANIGKTKFLAAVGHDILQPLNAARLYTSSLVEKLASNPARDLAGNVDDALESVEDILGAVLAISRLDSGALAPNITTFPVARLFERLEVEFRPIADAKGLDLAVISNSFHVLSDYNLLRRLLQNLVSNAIKYSDTGQVTLDARIRGKNLIFIVQDTGQGIRDEDQEAIFQEFKRLDDGKKVAEGLGLGLSIVKRLAETLDHLIKLDSAPGRGTTFEITTPLAIPREVAVGNTNISSAAPALDLSGVSVICIDNEPRILAGMKSLLGGWGCEVITCEGSGDLSANLGAKSPDIVIADYHLENETGLDVIAQIRGQTHRDLAAVLVTADRSAAVRKIAEASEVALLHKPLKPAALRAVFARILAQRPVAAE